jgi:type VI secretion system protein ImpF
MRTTPRLRLSLLDLLSEDPASLDSQRPLPGENLRALKDSVRSNLDAVLNSRRLNEPVPREFDLCVNSLLSYGLPDFTSFAVTNEDDRELLGLAVEAAVRQFEPRLTGVTALAEPIDPQQPRGIIHYRIDGWLKVEPAPEPVTFDTVFEASKWHFLVVNGR